MFLTNRFYIALTAVVVVIAAGYVAAPLYAVGVALLWLLCTLLAVELVLLYARRTLTAERHCAERFSNGDNNDVTLAVTSTCPFRLHLAVVDELPFVFQRRDVCFRLWLPARGSRALTYQLRPTRRGAYGFGHVRVFASTVLGLAERRYTLAEPEEVKVYPSYLALRRYEFLAINNRLSELGIKRIRRVGNHTEFEQIKDYVRGDDYRRINWKASARRHQLMVNQYTDERSQQIICLIDKGRVMQQSFEGMTLLDYSINASLVLSYIAMRKDDRAGLATFCDNLETFVAPSKSPTHIQTLLESLYAQHSTFGETDYAELVDALTRNLNKRSLLVLFTSFTSMVAMRRQLPYLRQLNRRHRLLVVFFEDNELTAYTHTPARSTEDFYHHVIAEKMAQDQRLIVSMLKQQGILSLLTKPENLSVDVINKYLELKARQQLV